MTTLTTDQRLDRLARSDKWYLSAGDGILWAPAFPVWLHAPGFWDEAHVYYHPFAPLFSVALIGVDGREIPLRQVERRWRPDGLTCRYLAGEDGTIGLIERRHALGRGRFASTWTVEPPPLAEGTPPPPPGAVFGWSSHERLRGAHLVAFTAQPGETVGEAAATEDGTGVRWRRALTDRREQKMEIDATLAASIPGSAAALGRGVVRVAALRSEGSAVQPHWRFTPFVEKWDGTSGLREEVRLEGINALGLVYAAVDVPLTAAGAAAVEFGIELLPVEEAYRLPEPAASTQYRVSPTRAAEAFFEQFPVFRCADAFLEKYYDYRIYGLRLCRLEGGAGNVKYPAIAEGISYFHVPITYSGQCHMFEMRWCRDPGVARGTLLNFLEHQKEDGSFHGRIYTNHLIGTDFYLASWGDAVLAVDALHPDDAYLERVYGGLSRYAAWMDRSRDPEGSGMYDVINHFETGQEYMSRYQAVNPKADLDGWKESTRLKAIDATVYAYLLHRALGRIAGRVGRGGEAAAWGERAERVGRAIQEKMWDEATGMYSDVDPRTGKRTGVQAAVCFYPMMTDLPSGAQVGRLLERLTDERGFGTPWPAPSSAVSDPLFDAEAEWKGKRHVCPWNGRVWPMTNSHVVDGLIRQWRQRELGGAAAGERDARHRAGVLAGEMLGKYVRMMYHDRDVARPNCFEHYNPFTGHACEYRGIDDYQHSWVLDLLIRGVLGVDPGYEGRSGRLVVDPLPGLDGDAEVGGVRVGGTEVGVRRAGGGAFEVTAGGRTQRSSVGTPVVVELA